MARGKCTYSLIKGLYGEAEKARREYENDPDSEGGRAYGLWLELLEIADWHFEGAPGLQGDSPDLEGSPDAQELGPAPAGQREQLQLPGMRELDAPVPRGTHGEQGHSVAVVGTAGLSTADLVRELTARGVNVASAKRSV